MSNLANSAKKILIVDDSALMRRVFCDIISCDGRFEVVDQATDGLAAFDLLSRKQYDAVVLDVNMPKLDGLELLRKLQQSRIPVKVMMASSDTREGAKITLDALELGALDFVHKPDSIMACRTNAFQREFLDTLDAVANSSLAAVKSGMTAAERKQPVVLEAPAQSGAGASRFANRAGSKVVAITSSTGGPKALQAVIPRLPRHLNAPVLLVQHMPKGFTASLAERLNSLSDIAVKEAAEGDVLEKGTVYIAMAGQHLNVKAAPGGKNVIHYSDEPAREGVKPCANYMFESLGSSSFDQVVCVVMTGMGADGTEGIRNLKQQKSTYVIAQDQATSTVYGMPKSVVAAQLSDRVTALEQIAQEIVLSVGV